ncbi:MAG: hypothetical protein ABFD16_06240 [Thermoguttaceae bacterium]
MKHGPAASVLSFASLHGGRMALLALCTLLLCSCKGPAPSQSAAGLPPGAPPALPREAYAGMPAGAPGPYSAGYPAGMPGAPGMEAGVPFPATETGPWAPPGLPKPWPYDEYVADGGDDGSKAVVGPQWEVGGLEPEDTIGHYDTIDGRRVVAPSNRVHIYSPRFGAVRQVVSLKQDEQMLQSAGVYSPTKLVRHDEVQTACSQKQQLQVEGQLGRDALNVCLTKQGNGAVSCVVGPRGFQDAFLPFENLAIIRQGIYQSSEMAFLAEGAQAAIAWSHTQAVQVILDQQRATEAISDQPVGSVFTVNEPPARPKLRVIKIASTNAAKPGEFVDFTIRFDNVGNQPIGNVTIIDSLSGRLELVPGSAQCNLPGNFLPQPNASGSLVLRWEITDPLKPGQGGIARFRCVVR